jgi:hypothetical protein
MPKKANTKKTKTKVHVAFIQDRSGSMASVWQETLSGFKTFVKDLKAGATTDGVDYTFTLTVFDDRVETPITNAPIAQVEEGALAPHRPRGSTALYDAVGKTLKAIEDAKIVADKFIAVIVTDGQENISREWTKIGLQKEIESRLTAGNWTFTYLGTQPETWADASATGINAGSTVTYTGAQAQGAYVLTSQALRVMAVSCNAGTRTLYDDHTTKTMRNAVGVKLQKDVN